MDSGRAGTVSLLAADGRVCDSSIVIGSSGVGICIDCSWVSDAEVNKGPDVH